MNEYTVVRTASWQLRLPADWADRTETASEEVYFESADGTKGVYIATWNIPMGAEHDGKQAAKSFRRAEQASLRRMQGYSWDLLQDESITLGATTVAISDAFARGQAYRIASKVIAHVPLVVRAAFHDYQCDDLAASQRYFADIIESLRLNWDGA
ncbi:MAG TPA: hypothetical protein VHA82_16275 [Ramlibacter sp.]|uniref:hypothetical protein n=1 Tax=Ramlibacter sp. TaxID=1917967 RepID=UPI002D090CC3|nr:hypothetical protein [Ramlibacter sp.]HVZ45369.1 hypothetical protein [Ramlibacter sp.]